MNEGRFEGVGGLRIFTRSWRPQGKPRAVVVISHGFNSHSGHYLWAAEQFVAHGLAVYALDHRGRGKSDGERFYVEKFADYVHDLATFIKMVKAQEPGTPVFLLGHSAGGVISCGYALEYQDQLAGLICESFAHQVPAPDFALAVLKGISHLAPHAHVFKLKNEDFSRDPKWVDVLNADPLIAHEVQPTQDRGGDGARRRAAEEGLPAHQPAGADHPRHGRQGDQAERQPALLRHGRLDRQDAEDLRGPLSRPARGHRQGGRDVRHPGVDRQALAGVVGRGDISAPMRAMLVGLLPVLTMLACGSGGSTPGDGGGAGGAGGGPMTWLDNGVRQTASFASASRVISASLDLLQVTGSNSSGAGVSFIVSAPPPLVPGTYSCGVTGGNIIVSLAANGSDNATVCTIQLAGIGAVSGERATGTFQATVMATGGGVKAITDGVFDVPLIVNAAAP